MKEDFRKKNTDYGKLRKDPEKRKKVNESEEGCIRGWPAEKKKRAGGPTNKIIDLQGEA